MRIKTNKERQRKKASKKVKQEIQTKAPKFDVLQMLRDLSKATQLTQQLTKEGVVISEVLEEYNTRLKRIEDAVFTSDDKRRGDAKESPGTDNAESGRGVYMSPVQETGEDLQETPACGDGVLSD